MLIATTLLAGCQSEEEKAKERMEQIMGSEPSNYKTETIEEAREKAEKLNEKIEQQNAEKQKKEPQQ